MKAVSRVMGWFASMVDLAAASERTDAMVSLEQFTEAFNRGDWKGAYAAGTETTAIVDDFRHTRGTAPARASVGVPICRYSFIPPGITDGRVTLSKPGHVDITGDRGDPVVPPSSS